MLRIILIHVFLLYLKYISYSQNIVKENELTFMFYNTENFFDAIADTTTNDKEFTPEGARHWTDARMHFKAERLAKVILAAGQWNPPVCVGLCEIENLQTLELLTGIAPLKKYKYKNLINFLNTNSKLNPDEQYSLLSENFDKWKGNLEQLDDVLLFGMKV